MKKLIIIGIPLVLAIAGGLAFTGKINIPGITPKKSAAIAAAMYGRDKDQSKEKFVAETKVDKPAVAPVTKSKAKLTSRIDPAEGASSLATIWNELPVPALLKIIKKWKNPDLAVVMAQMDTGQVAKLLEGISKDEPDRASELSKALQKQGSIVPLEES